MIAKNRLYMGAATLGVLAVLLPFQNFTSAKNCSEAKIKELLEDAQKSGKSSVSISCSFKLDKAYRITKKVNIYGAQSSDIALDFAGSLLEPSTGTSERMIHIYSQKMPDGTFSRPENIRIQNANIVGAIRIRGMSADDLREPSRHEGLTKVAQAAAPKNISISKVRITANGTIPLYVEPGTTYVRLEDSKIEGSSNSTAIYLDAESGYHVIRNNKITSANKREAIAVDGSAHNTIVDNYFSNTNEGSIFLYRNCGERSVSRHQSPQFNLISNNTFYYKKYDGSTPAIHIGSRQGNRKYCGDDRDSKFGSGVSDLDFASNNTVINNQFINRSPAKYILDSDSNNTVAGNQQVSEQIRRASACFVPNGYPYAIVPDGNSINRIFKNNQLACTGFSYTCDDGELAQKPISCPTETTKITKGSCSRGGSNDGCSSKFSCPAGQKIAALRGGCNLETASNLDLSKVTWNSLEVLRASDNVKDGTCQIGAVSLKSGKGSLASFIGQSSASLFCKEHDKNGGDCTIQVEAICQ